MHLDRHFRDAQLRGNLFVQSTRYQQLHYLAFAQTEQLVAVRDGLHASAPAQGSAAGLQCRAERCDRDFFGQWLGQEFARPGLHGPHGCGYVG